MSKMIEIVVKVRADRIPVSARKETLTIEEFESKHPPLPRRGVCAPLDVAILNQQRAALRALALTKTQADLTTWFQGGPDNESHALKVRSLLSSFFITNCV